MKFKSRMAAGGFPSIMAAIAMSWAASPALPQTAGQDASLEEAFRDPPAEARPRVWWHWMNGNISKDGIAKDLAWMKRVGIGGLQNFDANLQTPQIVDKRLVYMTPEWKDAFRFTATEADRLGLELAIAASPGWSETGGPWVPPADGLKKLVWSETEIVGGKRFSGRLAAPPTVTGPFQSLSKEAGLGEMMQAAKREVKGAEFYADVAVLAVPVPAADSLIPQIVRDGTGKVLDAARLSDDALAEGVVVARSGTDDPTLVLEFAAPRTVQSASAFLKGSAFLFFGGLYDGHLEASDDGKAWLPVAELAVRTVPTTISFAPITARQFRLRFSRAKASGIDLGTPAPGLVMGDMGSAFSGLASKPMEVGDFRLFAVPRVDSAESKAGFYIEKDYYALSRGVPEALGVSPERVIDLTARMKPDGSLDWTAPKGNWRVLRLGASLLGTTNHPAPPEATGLEVDKFDRAAVRRYMEHYIGLYRDAAGADMVGKRGVRAILTDSIEVGAANWTPRMVEQFRRLRGYDPKPWLPALTGVIIGTRAQSDAFLYDYRRTLADLMTSEHYGTVARVARENGIRVYGEALEDNRPSLGDDMAMRSHADVPMAAMWTYSREKGPKPTYLADIKGAASVAHIHGQNLVAAESLTASMNPWNYAPADLKRVIDLEFVTGVNRPVIHTSVHQPVDDKLPGLSLFIFGQYFNRHESWAELARPWVDYIARNSLMLQRGRNVADVGYFYGEEAPLTGLYGQQQVADAPVTSAYDFVNADALMTALVNDGAELVTPGGARYRALYLGGSSRRMTLAALTRLAQLAEGGATVVGLKPEGNPGLAGDAADYAALVAKLWPGGEVAQVGKGQVIAGTDIEAALRRIGVAPDFRVTGGQADTDIPFVHRRLADGDSYFVVNRKNRPETVEAHFRVTGKAPELWDAQTGTSRPASYRIENGETIVPLALGPEDSVHVVFRKPATAAALTVPQPAKVALGRIDGPWTVRFQAGRGAPPEITLPALAPLETNADPAIRYFSGVATYARTFKVPARWKPDQSLWLDLGQVHEVAEVSLNGKVIGTAWRAPYRIDIGAAAKRGTNRLEVKVANLWVNRLIGDAQPGATKLTWTSPPTYRADAPLRPSGLIGPVTLQTEGK